MPKEIIILGGIGNGTVIADAIEDAVSSGLQDVKVLGFLNDLQEAGTGIEKWLVLGGLAKAKDFIEKGCYFINTIYRIDGNEERIQLFKKLAIPDSQMFTFVHPKAYLAPSACIGYGSVLMPQTAVSAGAVIGKGCLVMPGATIGHNTVIADFCHLAAQSCLSSYVTLQEGVHIGLNATVGDKLTIGQYSTLGMGSVLLKDIPRNEVWAGNPARFLRNVK